MNPTQERWLPVVGHEGYRVSADGRVLGKSGKILSPVDNGHGYFSVAISGAPRRYVHQLVLEAFVGPRPPAYQARHLNGCRGDNRLENLAWSTPSENARDKRQHGTDHYANRDSCSHGHRFTPENTKVRDRGPTADGSDRITERVCMTCSREHDRKKSAVRSAERIPKPPRTRCRRGHDISGDNGHVRAKRYERQDGSVGVSETVTCRTCERGHSRRSEAKRKAARHSRK